MVTMAPPSDERQPLIHSHEIKPVNAQPSFVPVSCSHVIGPMYTSNDLTELVFEKTEDSAAGEFSVSKAGRRMFTLSSYNTTFHSQLQLLDEDGEQVAMLRKKNATGHARWVVSCVAGNHETNLEKVFSVRKSHMIQRHQKELELILEKENSAADFKVKGSWKGKRCTIQAGDSSKVAEMCTVANNYEEKFKVKVYPNVDCAFVVTLIAIVDAMKSSGKLKVAAGHAAKLALNIAAATACAALGDPCADLF